VINGFIVQTTKRDVIAVRDRSQFYQMIDCETVNQRFSNEIVEFGSTFPISLPPAPQRTKVSRLHDSILISILNFRFEFLGSPFSSDTFSRSVKNDSICSRMIKLDFMEEVKEVCPSWTHEWIEVHTAPEEKDETCFARYVHIFWSVTQYFTYAIKTLHNSVVSRAGDDPAGISISRNDTLVPYLILLTKYRSHVNPYPRRGS